MFDLRLGDLRRLLHVPPSGTPSDDCPVRGVSIDSRQVTAGDLFVALPGDRTHGALFAADALRSGAAAVLTDGVAGPELPADRRIVVPDAVHALQAIGRDNRARSDALVIGVTGSVGKTTTRQMICHLLDGIGRGLQSHANHNNHLGVPLTLSRLTADDEFAVVELGASAAGEIAHLAELARPEFAVVTAVAEAHLSGFGSLEGVRRGKQELVEAMRAEHTVFLNADDPRVAGMAAATAARVVTFGRTAGSQVRAEAVHSVNDRLRFRSAGRWFELPVTGERFLPAALATVAIGREIGLPDGDLAARLRSFCPGSGRGRVIRGSRLTVIDDTYNACPASVMGAVSVLESWRPAGRRILVLGDMLELGDRSDAAHAELGQRLAAASVDHCLLFGRYASRVADAALRAGRPQNGISVFSDITTLQTVLDCVTGPGDAVLIKGSRAMRLERLLPVLGGGSHRVQDPPRAA